METKEKKINKPIIVIKYGGNAMTSEDLQKEVIKNICKLKADGNAVVIVHGGGPFIQETLDMANVESEFVGGHRKTTPEALKYVEMALRGQVNGKIVNLINNEGQRGVGLSGRDGKIVTAKRMYHMDSSSGEEKQVDIGQVGEVESVDTTLIYTLLENDYIPVITCIANNKEGESFNINADLFAGSLAGYLNAEVFGVLTDVDGLLRDVDDPASLLSEIKISEIKKLLGQGIIVGGMIPKVDACRVAVEQGAGKSMIVNGTKPEQILEVLENKNKIGTTIKS